MSYLETIKTARTPYLLLLIGVVSFLIRSYYFPKDIPLTLDAIVYFFYATDVDLIGHIPPGYNFPNNGWPILISILFRIFHFNNFLGYMELQRTLSLVISVLTIIPVYLLCRRFFDKKYSLLGASIFAFEPRLIQNSLLGLTEPLYILLVTFSLFCFLSNKKIMVYASFVLIAISSAVRYEGLLLLIIFSIIFCIRYRKEKLVIPKYLLALALFVLLLAPIAYVRIHTMGYDGLTSNVIGGVKTTVENSTHEKHGLLVILTNGAVNFFKYLGWISIPIFVFFVPVGVILLMKKLNYKSLTVILSIFILSLPAFYAYSRDIQETKYLYVLYPLFCIVSTFAIRYYSSKFNKENVFLILVIVGILLSANIFLDLKKVDYEHQKDAFAIAQYVSSIASGTNDYYPEDAYLTAAQIPKEWPVLKSSIDFHTHVISTEGYRSLEEYLASIKEQKITHLVVDESNTRPTFLKDVFNHEEKYPYLIKKFDSTQNGLKYRVKIYEINYTNFEKK